MIRRFNWRILVNRRECASMTEPIVRVRNLHAWYGSSHVLQGVDLTVLAGQTVGLLGRNGMGKSTLIRAMLGHVSKRSGEVMMFGQDVSRAKPHQIARLGVAYVPEGRGVFTNLTVRENLVMAAHAGRDGRCDFSLAVVLEIFPRLAERLGNLGSQLSGGEQQMLAIGRALMMHPDVLVLDEATEGLAPLLVDEIWRVIARVKATGMAILIVDRNYRKVLSHSDHALVLVKGEVALQGTAQALELHPELTSLLGV